MPEPMSPETPRQPINPPLPERLAPTHEIKQFPIKADGKETHYPENYPFSFIADGPVAEIRRATAFGGERTGLTQAIETYLRPSQEVFDSRQTPPKWYEQILAPLLEKPNFSLQQLKPENLAVLGDDFRGVLEKIWDFSIPEELRARAARNMGQTEGTIPTLSALIQHMRSVDPDRFTELMNTLLQKGPDGFVMAAYLAALTEEKAEKEEPQVEEFSFDKIVSTKDGQPTIDTQAMRELVNTTWKDLREFDSNPGDNGISYAAGSKIVNTKAYKETPPKE